jgi:hypothetical protein
MQCRAFLSQAVSTRAKIEVIPSGIDLNRNVQRADRNTLEALGVPENAPLVVMIAALVNHKDPLTFVSAMKEVVAAVPALMQSFWAKVHCALQWSRGFPSLASRTECTWQDFATTQDSILAAADAVALELPEEGLVRSHRCSVDGEADRRYAGRWNSRVIQHEKSGLLASVENAKSSAMPFHDCLPMKFFAVALRSEGERAPQCFLSSEQQR